MSRESSFLHLTSNDAREAQELSARLASSASRSERADASLAERTAIAERVSIAHERGDAITIDIAQDPHNLQMFMRYADQYGGDSASAQVMMASELARRSLQPQLFSDATALPTSFGALAEQHRRNSVSPTLSPDLAQLHQAKRERVRGFDHDLVAADPSGTPSALRAEIQDRGAHIRDEVANKQHSYDAQAGATQSPEGTLVSAHPLLKRSADQARKDATLTFDAAKRAVQDALKR